MLRQRNNNNNLHKLIEGFHDHSSHERAKVRRKLIENYGSEALPSLMELFSESNNPTIKKEAILTLKELRNPIAAPFFVQALSDTDLDIRWIAAEAIAKSYDNDKTFAVMLIALLEDTDNYNLRKGVHHVIKLMKERGTFTDPHNILGALNNDHIVYDHVRVAAENTLIDITRRNWGKMHRSNA